VPTLKSGDVIRDCTVRLVPRDALIEVNGGEAVRYEAGDMIVLHNVVLSVPEQDRDFWKKPAPSGPVSGRLMRSAGGSFSTGRGTLLTLCLDDGDSYCLNARSSYAC
jgi:hypothetical protein